MEKAASPGVNPNRNGWSFWVDKPANVSKRSGARARQGPDLKDKEGPEKTDGP